MTRRSAAMYAAALDRAWSEAPVKDRPGIVKHFLELVIRQRASKLIPRVIERLAALDQQRRKSPAVTVRVATEHAGMVVRDELHQVLGKADVTVHEDPAILGGASIRLGDTLIDGTVATQLQCLHTKLIS